MNVTRTERERERIIPEVVNVINSLGDICTSLVKKFPVCETMILKNVPRIYTDPQELRSLLRNLIPELILSQKHHIHMGPIGNCSGVMSF